MFETETPPTLYRVSPPAHKQSSLLLSHGIRGILKKLQVAMSGPIISQFPCAKWLKAYKWIFHRALPPAAGSPFPCISFLTNPPGRNNLQNNSGLMKFWAIHPYLSAWCPVGLSRSPGFLKMCEEEDIPTEQKGRMRGKEFGGHISLLQRNPSLILEIWGHLGLQQLQPRPLTPGLTPLWRHVVWLMQLVGTDGTS